MSPSIDQLFGEGGAPEFDGDKLAQEFDAAFLRTDPGIPSVDPPVADPPQPIKGAEPAGEVAGGEGPTADPPTAPPSPAVEPPPAVVNPFADLTDTERDALMGLHRVMTADPDKRDEILRVVVGQKKPEPEPEPQLPSHIDPDSVEADLWNRQQKLERQLADVTADRQAEANQRAQSQAMSAAQRASDIVIARYGQVLGPDELMRVGKTAAARGLPATLANSKVIPGQAPSQEQLVEAYTEAMEMTIRSDDALLARVLGAAAGQPAPVPEPPRAEEKRQLTALSAAAGFPSGNGSGRTPLTTRPDGRLDEPSRLSAVSEVANALKGIRGEL